ncbi:hypothetical protein L6164_015240 [Bauhinia variegata]|uniref:Uncharacterized protein n=1 Tax=Bauhinia variegata TaxID=167791 RepID=A0ACB9NLX9_BAUVA|nr:hypothetical protein L6164_015240 [Bauhinia variegata]
MVNICLSAAALRIKDTLPAYRDPNLRSEDLPTGVSFASGGSGNDNLTASIQGVLSLATQLQMFKEYIGKLKGIVGEEKANSIIPNSLYLLSAGNNDIAITYSATARRGLPFPTYANLLVGWASDFLKDLYEVGARRVWVLSTLPLGCLPGARATCGGFCIDITNKEAEFFNTKLSSGLDSLKRSLSDYDLTFVDVYTPLLGIINNPQSSGFNNVANGCCGTGTIEIGVSCNVFNPLICPNPSTHVFWDAGHPTQRAYEIVVSDIIRKIPTLN